jgi:hypothetical protein
VGTLSTDILTHWQGPDSSVDKASLLNLVVVCVEKMCATKSEMSSGGNSDIHLEECQNTIDHMKGRAGVIFTSRFAKKTILLLIPRGISENNIQSQKWNPL